MGLVPDRAENTAMTQAIQSPKTRETDPYWVKFEQSNLEAKQPSWLFPLRKAAMTRFAEIGFLQLLL